MRFLLTLFFVLTLSLLFSQNEFFLKVKNTHQIDLSFNEEKGESIINHPLSSFISGYNISSIESPFNTKDLNLQNTYFFKVDSSHALAEIVTFLSKEDFTEYVEIVPKHELFYTPNDPLFPQQYALDLINAEFAWDISTCMGNSNVVIAITDDAVRLDHEDLINSLWNNPNEIPNNGIDDDGNGYVDDIVGWDAADNDNNPNPPNNANNSYFSHGTHVAGIAGATTDNGVGMSSSGFGVRIMPVKIGADANGSLTGSFSGLDYAISCGYVDVVNMSWGGGSYSTTLQNLINAGHNLGITFVAAAGNSNTSAPMYPAAYNHVISVAASNQNDIRASFSNYGTTIDVTAPGVGILSTVAGATNAYDTKSGTSMASPLVAGLCGLMKCYDNGITPDEIENCLKTTADDIYTLNPSYQNELGAGRINAQAALNCMSTVPIASFVAEDTVVCPNQAVQFMDNSSGTNPLTWSWQFPGGTPATSTQQNPTVTYNTNGNYTVTLSVTNVNGTDILTKTNYITVENPTAAISGNGTISAGGAGFLKVDFTGTPPFNFSYTNGTSTFTETGIIQNPYYIQVNPIQTTSYNLLTMSDGFCNGIVSGNGTINVTQNNQDSCTSLFQKIIDDNSDNEKMSIYNTSDGGYIVAGSTADYGQGGYDFFVMKYDSNNNLLWSNTYGTLGNDRGYPITILEMENHSLIISTESSQYGSRVQIGMLVVFKLDINGNLVWQKRLNSNIDYVHGSKLMRDNSEFILVGSAGGDVTNGVFDDAYIMKFDTDGNVLWSHCLLGNSNDHNHGIAMSGSDYVLTGQTASFGNNRSGTILKYSNAGQLLWIKNYDIGSSTETLTSVQVDAGGNIYSFGTSSQNDENLLLKTDENGNMIFAKLISGANSDRGTNMKLLTDGLLLSGYTNSFGHGGYDLFVSKFDFNGNEIWTKIYGGSNDEIVYFRDTHLFIDESDGTGMVSGATRSFGGSDNDPYLVKFSLGSDTLCNEISGQFWTVSNVSPTVNTITFPTSPMPGVVNSGLIQAVMPVYEQVVCSVECEDSIPPITNPICENTSTSDTLCLGDSLQLNVRSGSNYAWEANYNISNTTIQNPIVWPETDTSYIVYYEDSACQYFDTFNIAIQAIIVDASPDDTTVICSVDDLQLNATGADYYTWSPSANLNNATISNPIFSGNISETIIVEGQNQFGCSDSDTVYIEVLPCCGAYPDFSASDTTICIGDSILFTDLSVSGNNPSYTWNFGNNATPNSFNGTNPNWISFANPGSFEIELILTDDCGTDTAKLTIFVNDLPPTNIANDTTVCGLDTLFYELGDIEIVGNDYIWSPSAGLSNSTIANPIAAVTDSSFYTVVVVDQFTGCINTDSVKVKIIQEPDSILKLIQTSFCEGDTAIIFIDYQGADSIVWQNQINNIDTFKFQVLNDSLIQVKLFIDNCMFTDSILINADSIPTRSFDYQDTLCLSTWDTILVQTLGTPVWQNNDTTSQYPLLVSQDTTLYLSTYNGSCNIQDTIQIYTRALPEDSIEGQDSVCIGSVVQLSTSGLYNYEWSNGSVYDSSSFEIQTDSTIYVTFENAYCTNTDTFYVTTVDTPQINILGATNYCQGDLVELSVNSTDSLYWENGDIGNNFSDIADIAESIIVVNQFNNYCGIVSDSLILNIDTIPLRQFSFRDTVCQGDSDTIVVTSTGLTVTENNDTINQIDFVVNTDTTFILETYNGACSIQDTIHIYTRALPVLKILGNDTTCINSTETYSLPTGYTYLWSNGSVNNLTDYSINSDTVIFASFSNGYCNNSDTLNVFAIDTPQVIIQGDTAYCEGEIINLSVNTTDSIWWSVGSNENPFIDTATLTETITVTLFNNYCGNFTSSVNINLDTFPQIEIESSIEILENETHQILVEGNASSWSWTPPYGLSCINCQNPIVDIDSNMIYILAAENNGCFAYDTIEIILLNLENCLLIPTAFSPNNDGVNDDFKAIVLDDKTIINSFKIYNRWGELLHDDISPWDGTFMNKAQNLDVYIYMISYFCDGEDKILTGNVTLIR